jgi:hypothetical protein
MEESVDVHGLLFHQAKATPEQAQGLQLLPQQGV